MAKRLTRSPVERTLEQIKQTRAILISSVRNSFSGRSLLENILLSSANIADKIEDIKASVVNEIEKYTSFDVISSIEAMFRIDYSTRCEKKLKDEISREFRRIYKKYENKANFEEHILKTWQNYIADTRLLNELRAIFQYRNWLAHGRYWLLKVNINKYDFDYLYMIALKIRKNLEGV